MKINILGVNYNFIKDGNPKKYPKLNECDGYTDWTIKEIVIDGLPTREEPDHLADLTVYHKKVMRHEIIHAFLFESGLAENTQKGLPWAVNETMIDFFAHQYPKMIETFEKVGAL